MRIAFLFLIGAGGGGRGRFAPGGWRGAMRQWTAADLTVQLGQCAHGPGQYWRWAVYQGVTMGTLVTRSVWVLVMELQLVVVQSHLLHLGREKNTSFTAASYANYRRGYVDLGKICPNSQNDVWMTSLNFSKISKKGWKNHALLQFDRTRC